MASGNAVRENPLVVETIESYFGHKCQTSLYPEEAVTVCGGVRGAAIGMGLVSPSDVPLPRTVPSPHFHSFRSLELKKS